ncbi:MAG: hypothetical protein OEY86_12530 [Nitrospira sp.]|nr:hypothetical protein [Nitrospira sp.]
MKRTVRSFAIIVFGVVFPSLVIFQAYAGISSLRDNVAYQTTGNSLIDNFQSAKKHISSANDYALFSLLYVEHANQKTMINKQVMKVSIVHIGFAVISVGLMLIILGIQEGGVEGGIDVQGLKFDFKTGSTGVAMFCIGAIMATVGGVLKNDYQTSEIPKYETVSHVENISPYSESIDAYKSCKNMKGNFETCFAQIFFQINKDQLK